MVFQLKVTKGNMVKKIKHRPTHVRLSQDQFRGLNQKLIELDIANIKLYRAMFDLIVPAIGEAFASQGVSFTDFLTKVTDEILAKKAESEQQANSAGRESGGGEQVEVVEPAEASTGDALSAGAGSV
jgi:hypothetical protein